MHKATAVFLYGYDSAADTPSNVCLCLNVITNDAKPVGQCVNRLQREELCSFFDLHAFFP